MAKEDPSASLGVTCRGASRHARLLALCPRDLLHLVELGALLGDFLGRHAREVVVVLLPVAVLGPAQRALNGRARTDRALQHLERQVEREALGVRLVRLAAGIAEREVAE